MISGPISTCVHRELLDQVFGPTRAGPPAELRAAMTADPKPNGADSVRRVVLDGPPDLARRLGSNHQVRLDSCHCVEFALLQGDSFAPPRPDERWGNFALPLREFRPLRCLSSAGTAEAPHAEEYEAVS